jgi:hypothetical protein
MYEEFRTEDAAAKSSRTLKKRHRGMTWQYCSV